MSQSAQYVIYRALAVLAGFSALGTLLLSYQAVADRSFVWLAELAVVFTAMNAIYVATDHKALIAQNSWSTPLSAGSFTRLRDATPTSMYALYLRPNSLDAQVRIYETFNPFQYIAFNIGMPFIEIQEWILRSSPPRWRFLSEGGLTTNIRPVALLSSDEHWFNDIRFVSDKIDAFVILPGTSAGIMKELDYFLMHRMNSIVLVVPPRRGNETYFASIKMNPSPLFEFIRRAPEDGALLIPERLAAGLLGITSYPLTKRSFRKLLSVRSCKSQPTKQN